MTPQLRKLALVVHIMSSIGWFGAVLSFLVLAVTGLNAGDALTAHGVYAAMYVVGWFVIVPLTFASFATGLIQALGTPWGLFRHYWTIMKLSITAICSALVLLHMRPTGALAGAPVDTLLTDLHLQHMRTQLIADSSLALGALLVTAALAIYKPSGTRDKHMPRWVKVLGAIGVVALLFGHGFAGHGR